LQSAMHRVLADHDLRRSMGVHSRELIRRDFTLAQMVGAILSAVQYVQIHSSRRNRT
jgi:hypothetical protein